MFRKYVSLALCALILGILLVACGDTGSGTPDAAHRTPFSLYATGEDGVHVSWSGYTDGYRAGATETMALGIRNKTDQRWNGRFCVQLLEPQPSTVVVPLAQGEFDLVSEAGRDWDIRAELPETLSTGTYGLALIVHEPTGPIMDVTTVHVGQGEPEPFQGEWPTEAAFEACPAP